MRRASISIAAACAACGGLLGIDEEDNSPPATPAGDAGADAPLVAEGGSTIDAGSSALGPGCARRTMNLGGDLATLKDNGAWHEYEHGSATLAVESGQLVARSGDGGTPGDVNEASLFFKLPDPSDAGFADVVRMRCTMAVAVSTFADRGRLLQLRLFPGTRSDFDDSRVDWTPDGVRAASQVTLADGGPADDYSPLQAPSAVGTPLSFIADLTLEPTPRFVVDLGSAHFDRSPAASIDRIREGDITVGIYAPVGATPYEVRYSSVTCDICVRQ